MTPAVIVHQGPVRLASRSLLRSQPDARLVALARAGHRAAFDAIVDRYQRPLRSYCRRLAPDGREEDVVQQAFLNAHRALATGEGRIDLRPWLYTIARHAAIDAVRANPAGIQVALDEAHGGVAGPEEIAERRERLDEALGAVCALPAHQGQALVLQELEGLSQHEIAGRLGLSEGAVRQLVHRARATLRRGTGALIPLGLLERLLAPATAQGAAATGGTLVVAKAAAVVVVTGAVVTGAGALPGVGGGDGGQAPPAAVQVRPAVPALATGERPWQEAAERRVGEDPSGHRRLRGERRAQRAEAKREDAEEVEEADVRDAPDGPQAPDRFEAEDEQDKPDEQEGPDETGEGDPAEGEEDDREAEEAGDGSDERPGA